MLIDAPVIAISCRGALCKVHPKELECFHNKINEEYLHAESQVLPSTGCYIRTSNKPIPGWIEHVVCKKQIVLECDWIWRNAGISWEVYIL